MRTELEYIDKIVVYPQYFEIIFSEEKEKEAFPRKRKAGCKMRNCRIDTGNTFDYFGKKQEEREKIVEKMRETPSITARELASELNMSLSEVTYKIRVLRKEGRIAFFGSGGRGKWEIREKNEM